MSEYKVSLTEIEKFLHGCDPEEHIVNIHYVPSEDVIYKVKEDPNTKKTYLEKDTFTPFMWMGELNIQQTNFYGGSTERIAEAKTRFGITVEKLNTHNHTRINSGFKFMVKTSKSYQDLLNFLKYGGLSTYVSEFELIDKKTVKPIDKIQTRSQDDAYRYFMDNARVGKYKMSDDDIESFLEHLKGKQETHRLFRVNKVPLIICPKPEEQYLISKGKRLYKGYEDYHDVHKLVFDIETEGLDPSVDRIYLTGMKDNRGFEELIHADNNDDSERLGIIRMFEIIDELRPAIIGTYNGANFDWPFIFKRCEVLGLDIQSIAKTLNSTYPITNVNGSLKLGSDVESYTQTNMWGYSVIDISHSARKAQAIDSGMKKWGLKYVCQYNEVSKRNRVYIDGKKLSETWASNEKFWFTDISGKFSKNKPNLEFIPNLNERHIEEQPNKVYVVGSEDRLAKYARKGSNLIVLNTDIDINNEKEFKKAIIKQIEPVFNHIHDGRTVVFDQFGLNHSNKSTENKVIKAYYSTLKLVRKRIESYVEVDGRYLLKRYLMDDLWETNEVDEIYNQSSFLLAKLIPTTYQRITTMGTAGLWQLLMLSWSYETGTAIPRPDIKRPFTGGLSRLLSAGYNVDLSKIDYSSLYPALQLAHDIFPSVDVTGALKSLLKYFHSERFKAKDLASMYKEQGNNTLASKYKRKQLPLKIFINSMYGALTAPQAFYWAEMDKGELVTCMGRQYLRLAVRYHMQLGFKALVLDTDGINFKKPSNINELRYIGKGYHERTEKDVEYIGIDAVIAQFNDMYMMGEMAVDLDGEWPACINFKRKNYALLEKDGKISLTGNTIKSRGMPEYIEEFIDEMMKLLLNNKGQEFVEYYYQFVKDLVSYEIPLVKIASKSKVKESISTYLNRGVTKTGQQKAKKAHMELLIADGITNPKLGDVVYYVNDGPSKSTGDVSDKFERDEKGRLIKYAVNENGEFIRDDDGNLIVDKKGKKRKIGINSYRIPTNEIEENPNKKGTYNYKKYLDALNTRLAGLLVVFKPEVRDKILINQTVTVWSNEKNRNIKVDIDTPELVEKYRGRFMNEELELTSDQPISEEDQDTLAELFTPESKELKYWREYHVGEPYDPRIWDDLTRTDFIIPKFNKAEQINEILSEPELQCLPI